MTNTNPARMKKNDAESLCRVYRDGLLGDTIPFWIRHAIDRDNGGYFFCLDRDGSLMSPDKSVWLTARFIWTLSTLYTDVEQRQEWLDLAAHGVEFLRGHCFDDDGRMFFLVTADGAPLRKRRYIFSETFGAIALSAFARASGETDANEEALDLFRLIIRHITTPGLLESKVNPEVRASKGLAIPMVLIATAQVLRRNSDDPVLQEWVDRSIKDIEMDFMKPDLRMVLESTSPDGEMIDTLEGRLVTPGHAIEAAWFILHESELRGGDQRLTNIATTILDWMWECGWDKEFGGILYYVDALGLSPTEYWHDMKFWWPHNETCIAMLMAWRLTKERRFLDRFLQVHKWAHEHFADPEYGEWYGYLHRDGTVSTPVKGTHWKGPFHHPRMQLLCWKMLEATAADPSLVE